MIPSSVSLRHPRRGFTLIELCLGLVITSLVSAAMAAFLLAVSANWQRSIPRKPSGGTVPVTAQSLAMTRWQLDRRLEGKLTCAKQVYVTRPGGLAGTGTPAAVMIRTLPHDQDQIDLFNVNTVRAAELALIQHDPTTRTLWLYRVQYPAGWTAAQRTTANNAASVGLTTTWLTGPSAPDLFKGFSYVIAEPLAHDVLGIRFSATGYGTAGASDAYTRTVLEYAARLQRGPETVDHYGMVTLRAPIVP